ncbi:helix-turn-helix transcriptional regulator [Kutzneria viridogrisea]|uniref:AAA family ATPase n=1 Tax=Kutzneria viridogrisea TaxID=47990 RepID=UPI0015FF1928
MQVVPRLGSGIPLVARSSERSRLRAAFARAQDGTASAALLSGDAGVGKTRLLTDLSEFAAQQGALVLTGRCVGAGSGLPYLPFADVLGQLRQQHPEALHSRPVLARLLPALAAEPASPKTVGEEADLSQLQLFDAVLGLFDELAGQRCVVLALEDMHWADSSSRHLLHFLLSRLRSQRLLVLVTYRADELHRRHPLRAVLAELVRLTSVERVELNPFDQADTVSFVRALADEEVTDAAVLRIATRSEGNPFFAEELLASCLDCGEPAAMPTGLADVLLSRIERLSPTAQQVIRAASVGGRRVGYARLHTVADLPAPDLEEALREAVQHNVLQTVDSEGAYTFRHALLREAVYNDLLPGERVRLHLAYAKQLRGEPAMRGTAARLAYHYMESHSLPEALEFSTRAATEADDLGAPGEALHYTEQALKLWGAVDDPESHTGVGQLKLLHRASFHAISAGELERGIAYAREAVNAADAENKPEAYRRLSMALMNVDGREDKAAEVINEAWELVRDQPSSPQRAWVLAIKARARRAIGDYQTAREMAEQAVSDACAAGSRSAEADALITLAVMDERGGDVEEACGRLVVARDRAIEAGAHSVELRAWFNLGINRYEQGLIGEAGKVFGEGLRRAQEAGLSWGPFGFQLRVLLVVTRYVAGDWAGVAEAADLPRDPVATIATSIVAAATVVVDVGSGRFEQAQHLLERLRPEWPTDFQLPMFCTAASAELHSWRGRPDRALEAVREGLAAVEAMLPRATGGIRLSALGIGAAADLAQRARRRRDEQAERAALEVAEELLASGLAAAEGSHRSGRLGPEGRAWLARLHAEHSRLTGAGDPEAWRAVVDGFGYGHSYERALARWRLAAAMLAAKQDGAAQQLALARESAQRLGAAPLLSALNQLAKRARIPLEDNGMVLRDTVDPLTPRERSVLSLVALGRTNREVGAELFISEKTVSVHLSRIMAKLGAGRRAEAVAAAYDRGLLEP